MSADGEVPCVTKKIRFESYEDAKAELARVQEFRSTTRVFGRGKQGRVERSIYFCNLCCGWHMTAKKDSKRRY